MVLRRKKDGSFSINSGRSVHDALERKDKIAAELEQAEEELMQTKIGQKIRRLREEADALTEAVNAYILRKYEPGEGYEDEHWKVTKVQSHRRKWNPDTLKRLIPHGLWKRCIKVEVVPAKVDELVRAGEIDMDAIEDAYEETPNAPYVKITRRSDRSDGSDEAAALLAKLGG